MWEERQGCGHLLVTRSSTSPVASLLFDACKVSLQHRQWTEHRLGRLRDSGAAWEMGGIGSVNQYDGNVNIG